MTAKKPIRKDAGEEGTPSFERSLERLETIVKEMEEGALSLEKMMEYFEEGQKLIAFCGGKLNEVERRIEILVKKGDQVAAEPFDEADTGRGEDESEQEKSKGLEKPADELF